MINGKSFTSNNTKLLKHLNILSGMQTGEVRPIMLHMAIINACNLNCSFCCFANRKKSDILSLKQMTNTVNSFKKVGIKSIEITGGGEPTLHPNINEIAKYINELGLPLGICTNGSLLRKVTDWNLFKWVRLGLYFYENTYEIDVDYIRQFNVDVTGAYVWDNPNLDAFHKMIEFAEKNKIPTRIAANAIKSGKEIERDMEIIKEQMKGYANEYVFLSDFNLKTSRQNNKCFMHLIKPFVFPDQYVYACPSFELAVENNANVNKKFRICHIDDIEKTYRNLNVEPRICECSFCKYSQQNELIEDILMETTHNEFV